MRIRSSYQKIDSDAYSYGFNGMERQDELSGEGNSYDFGGRLLDPRLGRWFSTDPKESKFAEFSTYNFVLNSPIQFIDPDGEEVTIHGSDAKATVTAIQKTSALTLSIDLKGRVTAELPKGPILFALSKLSKSDVALLTAINDKTVNVNLYTTRAEVYDSKDGSIDVPIIIGGMEGSEVINGKTETTQLFNLPQAMQTEKAGLDDAGTHAKHEILESYHAGVDDPGGDYASGYKSAHKKAHADDPSATHLYPNTNSTNGARGLTDGKGTTVDLLRKNPTKKFSKGTPIKSMKLNAPVQSSKKLQPAKPISK